MGTLGINFFYGGAGRRYGGGGRIHPEEITLNKIEYQGEGL